MAPRGKLQLRRNRRKTAPTPPPLPPPSIPTPAPKLACPTFLEKRSYRESAGIAAAECAAVLCCCPCCALNVLYLATVRLPAGLCRKAVREGKRRGRVVAVVPKGASSVGDEASLGGWGTSSTLDGTETESLKKVDGGGMAAVLKLLGKGPDEDEEEGKDEMRQLEENMWDWFHATGFWRSPTKIDWKL